MAKRSINKKRLGAVGLALVLAVGLGGAVMGAQSADPAETEEVSKDIYINAATPLEGDIVLSSEFVGTVEPDQHITVFPKMAGEILALHYNVGDQVNQGDVLMELDARDLQYRVSQTQAALSSASAKAGLGLSIAEKELETHEFNVEEGYNTNILNAQAAVESAENAVEAAYSALSTARRNLDDFRDGVESGVTISVTGNYSGAQTTNQYEDAVTQAEIQYDGAQLRLEQAREALRAIQMVTKEQAVSVEDQVKIAELNTDLSEQYIALESLQATLSDAWVKAPISGAIEYRYVDAHDMASPQSPAYVISNKDVMTISFAIPEASLPHIALGDRVTVEKNGDTCDGAVTEISTMVVNGLYPVKISVEQPPFTLNTGSTVKIFADAQKAEKSILVPIDAIHYQNGAPSVYVYQPDNGQVRQVQVETGIADETHIEIRSGLTLSDQVVVTWNSKLSDGAKVLLPGQNQDSGGAESGAGETVEAGDSTPAQ